MRGLIKCWPIIPPRGATRFGFRRLSIFVFLLTTCFWFPRSVFAHPASGIVVGHRERVYFLYHGLVRIQPPGQLFNIQEDSGGHWLALGTKGAISAIALSAYKRVFADGDSFLFGNGAPLAIAADGSLFYASTASSGDLMPDGATTLVRRTPNGSAGRA
jgi:hypothetical protein